MKGDTCQYLPILDKESSSPFITYRDKAPAMDCRYTHYMWCALLPECSLPNKNSLLPVEMYHGFASDFLKILSLFQIVSVPLPLYPLKQTMRAVHP